MKRLQELLAEAAHFKSRRGSLAQGLKNVDDRYRQNLATLEEQHASRLNNLESERQAALSAN